jgi:hypothetical protein
VPVEIVNGQPTSQVISPVTGMTNTNLIGQGGIDTVNVLFPDDPSQAKYAGLIYLDTDVERMVIDNRGHSEAVDWFTANGNTVGYNDGTVDHTLLYVLKTEDVTFIGGSSPYSTLTVKAGAAEQKSTIDGDRITLQAGGRMQFVRLSGTVASYTEGDFVLSGTAGGNPNIQYDDELMPAAKSANPDSGEPFVLTSKSGTFFSLFSLSLSGTGSTTVVGTNATGAMVTHTIEIDTDDIETFTMPANFVNLVSVSFDPKHLLLTSLMGQQTLKPGAALPFNPSSGIEAVSSYTRGDITISSIAGGSPNLIYDDSVTPAMRSVDPTSEAPFVLTAKDPGLFSLYSLGFIGAGSTTLTATTATGATFTHTLDVTSPSAVQTFTLPETFINLVSVSFDPSSLVLAIVDGKQTLQRGTAVQPNLPPSAEAIASYTRGSLTISSTASGSPNLLHDDSVTPAIKAADPTSGAPFVLTAKDPGLFSLYSLAFSGVGSTTLTATTASGATFTHTLDVSSPLACRASRCRGRSSIWLRCRSIPAT